MRMSLTRGAAAAAAVILVSSLAACGSDSDNKKGGGSGSGSATSGSPKTTFTGDPVTVMTIAPVDTQALNYPDIPTIAKAAVNRINDAGGLLGHEVKLLSCNDKNEANSAATCARQAVSAKAVAVVGGVTTNGASILPILAKANIPWIGPPGFTQNELGTKGSYLLLSGAVAFAGLGQRAVKDGCKNVTSVLYDTPATNSVNQLIGAGVKAAGGAGVKLVKVPTTTTDFSSVAKAAAQGDCAVVGVPAQQSAALAKAGKALNLKTKYYLLQLDDTTIKAAGGALEGAVSAVNFPVTTNAAWKPALDSGAKVDLSNLFTQDTWASYQVLSDVLKGQPQVSAATVTAGLNAAKAETAAGLTAPIDFSKPFAVPGLSQVFNRNVIFVKAQGDKVVQDGTYVDISSLFGS